MTGRHAPTAGDAAALLGQFPRGVAVVNLDAVAANVRALLRAAGPSTRLMAVVKADAYGHGATPVAITALRAGASHLAVACVDEGVALRQAGIAAPVLLLGATPVEEMARAVAHRLMPTICDTTAARALQAAAAAAGLPAVDLHVKIDTGLHRFGVAAAGAPDLIRWLERQPRLRIDGLYTHFSSAEEEDSACTVDEHASFAAVLAAVGAERRDWLLHAANSAAALRYPAYRLGMIRAGLALYGLAGGYPNAERLIQWPALEWHSRVTRLIDLAPGDAVGYGRTYVSAAPRQAAVVSVGYGDGFRRGLDRRGAVLLTGQRAPVIGRVSMDQIVVDATDLPARVGDPVTIVGRQGADEITAEEVAGWVETIPYEIVTGLAARLPRAYLLRGHLVGARDLLGARQLAHQPDAAIFRWAGGAGGEERASASRP